MKLYSGCERDLVIAAATVNKSTRWQLVLVNEQIVAVLDSKGDGVGLAGSLLLLPVVAASMIESSCIWKLQPIVDSSDCKCRVVVAAAGGVAETMVLLTHLLGAAAKNQHAANPRRTVFDIKRLIGRKLSLRRRPELLENKVSCCYSNAYYFMPIHTGAEKDLRFVYCAAAISSLLNDDWSGMDI
ncbi:hypothetical protein MKW98_015394 [Papaver atlanticum]|uniref:Uncharacterized protein n=1 Tax=Papaver atlanticum TaxID=357466 RepID=A0AAD4RY95_9MAGN|nr:hypothetical protein MKW98_015394 [Papaver atlanticum]